MPKTHVVEAVGAAPVVAAQKNGTETIEMAETRPANGKITPEVVIAE